MMVHESMANLKLDRRLLSRRGWISPQDLERELAELPDVGAKGELVGDAEDAASGPAAAEALPA